MSKPTEKAWIALKYLVQYVYLVASNMDSFYIFEVTSTVSILF